MGASISSFEWEHALTAFGLGMLGASLADMGLTWRGGSWLGMLTGKDAPPLYDELDAKGALPIYTPWKWLLALLFALYYPTVAASYYLVRTSTPLTPWDTNLTALLLILALLVTSVLWSWAFVVWKSPLAATIIVMINAATAVTAAVFAFMLPPASVGIGGAVLLIAVAAHLVFASILSIHIQVLLSGADDLTYLPVEGKVGAKAQGRFAF